MLALLAALAPGCGPGDSSDSRPPRGYLARLEVEHDGARYGFGPFVGYYFRPVNGTDLSQLEFACYNERQFYTQDLPAGALLSMGQAVLAELPDAGFALPDKGGRIRPVFFPDAPEAWLASRPAPQEEYLHFHSCYDARGATRLGYWLRHVSQAAFTYDMGGRVGPGSVLYHHVTPGVDTHFARIVEFDQGPGEQDERD